MSSHVSELIISSGKDQQGHTQSSSGFKVLIKDGSLNPEGTSAGELIAMSLATCLNATLKVLVKAKRIDVSPSIKVCLRTYKEDTASLGFYFELLATIHLPGLNDDDAKALFSRTKELCPVSKMLAHYPHVSIELKTK